jgi:hypothetical protein
MDDLNGTTIKKSPLAAMVQQRCCDVSSSSSAAAATSSASSWSSSVVFGKVGGSYLPYDTITILVCIIVVGGATNAFFLGTPASGPTMNAHYPWILSPKTKFSPSSSSSEEHQTLFTTTATTTATTNLTLRDYLTHPEGIHLALAPSFFGFYGYFGALAGIEEGLFLPNTLEDTILVGRHDNNHTMILPPPSTNTSLLLERQILKSVSGASAGAMAAILLAAGISPMVAANFCTTIQLKDFVDFPGLLSVFKGDKFEEIMHTFMTHTSSLPFLQLEDAVIPVAVSGFDVQSMETKILRNGSMARAARASACFPTLFQPVGWIDRISGDNYLLIDGGVADPSGLAGLAVTTMTGDTADADRQLQQQQEQQLPTKRVVNMAIGNFPQSTPPSPSAIRSMGVDASTVLSISIQNLPHCGPWAMSNGRRAVEAARAVTKASLDAPLSLGEEDGHYELHLDASTFIPSK